MGSCGLSCAGGTTKCGNQCIDTSHDPAHCGNCDHNCQGAACKDAMCQPIVLAGADPRSIAVDPSHAYWTNQGDGTVMKASLSGGSTTTLASGQSAPPERRRRKW